MATQPTQPLSPLLGSLDLYISAHHRNIVLPVPMSDCDLYSMLPF